MVYDRILICGGRNFNDKHMFDAAMRTIPHHLNFNFIGSPVIISGGATGADTLARDFAIAEGLPFIEFPADWKKHGKRAGYIRNKQMLDEGRANLVVAFPGGKGTEMMIDLATKANVLVMKISRDPEGHVQVDEVNPKNMELRTKRYQQMYIDMVKPLKFLTPGQKNGIMRDLFLEEEEWLKNMDKDYNEIMEAMEAMDGVCQANKS